MRKRNNINIKARINRHLRILREKGSVKTARPLYFTYSKMFVLFFIIFIFPIYPSLSSVFYQNNEYDFYRGDIDESSIIKSYIYTGGENAVEGNVYSFISVNTILGDDRDTSGTAEILNYTVKTGESYDSIAEDFGISRNTILWANNFSSNHIIHPGDKIKVPSVTGLLYKVKKGDTLEKIAVKYDIDVEKIEEQNGISKDGLVLIDQELILPGAKKIIPKVEKSKNYVNNKNSNSKNNKTYNKKPITTGAETGSYKLVRRKTSRNFARGNCTYFVSHYKNVVWRGNANQWIRNARAAGVPTGSVAKPGAIVQFSGRGYNPYYGHVGIVTQVNGSTMIVADMNYRRLNEVTYRKVSLNNSTIDGYIYAN